MLSPDWPGTCRETVAAATDGAPCFFMLGCCGDTNPMRCVCDDVKVAEAAGFESMRTDGLRKVAEGVTTVEEVLAATAG